MPRILFLAGLLLLPAGTLAHAPKTERAVVLQVDAEGLAALWNIRIEGPKVDLLVLSHDANRDGQLDDAENRRLALLVLSRGMKGVKLQSGDLALQAVSVEPRIGSLVPNNELVILGLLTYKLQTAEEKTTVSIYVDAHSETLAVRLQAQGPWSFRGSHPHPVAGDGTGFFKSHVVQPSEVLHLLLASEQPGGSDD